MLTFVLPNVLMKAVSLADYDMLLGEVKRRIRAAQYEALKHVNREMVSLYWDIGCMIGARQEGKSLGKSVVERLAADLHREFPGISGFSAQNLWRMRQFYMTYRQNPKLSPLVREIGWTDRALPGCLYVEALLKERQGRAPRWGTLITVGNR